MSKRACRASLFYNRLVFLEVHRTHILARPYPSDPYKTLSVFPLTYTRVFVTGSYASLSFLFFSSLHLSFSLTRFNPHYGLSNTFWPKNSSWLSVRLAVSRYLNPNMYNRS
ncbi:hypothetical protein ACTXT7_015326 [Hymenolepis weldensis]